MGVVDRGRARDAILLGAMVLVPLLVVVAAVLAARMWLVAPAPPGTALVASAAAAPVASLAEDPTPQIRGRILDAEGSAVEGATVRLVAPSPPYTVYRDTKTDAGGGFSFAHVGPWRVRVVADHDPGGVVSSAELHAREGRVTEITLVLSPASAVRGRVVDAQDRPVAGAVLSVEGVPWIVPGATSDEAGAFRLHIVPIEASSLVAVARGYRSARVALGERSDQQELAVVVRLQGASPVDGEVRDGDGNPVRARIVACEGQPSEARTESDDQGAFQLPPSAIGCDAVAEHPEQGASDAAPVVDGRRLRLRLRPGGGIAGDVVDERGAAIPAFTIGVEAFVPERGRSFDRAAPRSFSDVRGAFQLDRLAPGTYVLTASAPGKPPVRSSAVDVASGAVTSGVRVVLARGGTVTGRITDDQGAPLAGVDLHFDAVSSVLDSNAATQTDEAGQYRLEGAPGGLFTLRVHKDGFRLRLVSGLRVEPGGTLRQDVVLAPVNGGPTLELGGIGATLAPTRDGIALGGVLPGDPAERAGLRGGDVMVRIDGEPTEGMSIADALQRLRGEAGTVVGVTVKRPDSGEVVDVTIVRGTIVH